MNPNNPQNLSDQPAPEAPAKIDPPLEATAVKNRRDIFSGRLDRLGFLVANVYLAAAVIIAALIPILFFLINNGVAHIIGYILSIGFLGVAVFSVVLSVAVVIRRLHDIGVTGWLALILLVPGAAGVFKLILLFIPGTPGSNVYGERAQGTLKFHAVTGI